LAHRGAAQVCLIKFPRHPFMCRCDAGIVMQALSAPGGAWDGLYFKPPFVAFSSRDQFVAEGNRTPFDLPEAESERGGTTPNIGSLASSHVEWPTCDMRPRRTFPWRGRFRHHDEM